MEKLIFISLKIQPIEDHEEEVEFCVDNRHYEKVYLEGMTIYGANRLMLLRVEESWKNVLSPDTNVDKADFVASRM